MRVLAKAYDGEPLDRILTGCASGLAYVLNPSVVENGDIAELSGVGFPLNAVFQFDAGIFERLKAAWVAGDVAKLERCWREARALSPVDSMPQTETAMCVA